MPDYLRAYAVRAADGGKPGDPIRFIASTENVARDGIVINADGWQLDNYRKNPVVLWSHDYGGFNTPRPPIGRAEVFLEDRKLMADIHFDQDDDFAKSIERKYRNGFLHAVSVGWNTLEYEPPKGADMPGRAVRSELLDISPVPVPGDPDALKARQLRAYRDLGRELLALTDDDAAPSPDPTAETEPSDARASWDDVSASMVRLYRPHAQGPDDAARKAAYTGLARAYARHSKTPPEFIPVTALDALDVPTIRGLFLQGEPELHAALFDDMQTRAGATLSARNRDDLETAMRLIESVLARAKKEQESADDAERAANPLLALHALLAGEKAA